MINYLVNDIGLWVQNHWQYEIRLLMDKMPQIRLDKIDGLTFGEYSIALYNIPASNTVS